jgi:CheY-like chemotaxis protein
MQNIFIIEEDDLLRNNIAEILQSENYHTYEASGSAEAIEKLNSITPDLILSEAYFPKGNGVELLEYVRKSSKLANIPFIFLTGRPDYLDLRTSMNKGADDYFVKPFKSMELLESIKRRIEKKNAILDEIENLKKHILFGVQHEMRTPLVSILGYADIMMENIDTLTKPEIKSKLGYIRESGKKLHKMVEKYISFSGIKSELDSVRQSNNDEKGITVSNNLVREVVYDVCAEYPDKKVDIDILENNLKIDDYYFSIMLKELVENALKFSRSDFPVIIRGNEFEGRYFLVIYNRGEEVNSQSIHNVTSFMQYDEGIYNKSRIGAGLMIVKSVLEAFNGEFRMNIAPDGYTSAEVFLDIEFPAN